MFELVNMKKEGKTIFVQLIAQTNDHRVQYNFSASAKGW